jgi:hypothetical protein
MAEDMRMMGERMPMEAQMGIRERMPANPQLDMGLPQRQMK